MNRFTILVIFASLCFGSPASADERERTGDRFRLWNNCAPLDLVVENLSDDAAKVGLTREAVELAVRSRLRAARLYSEQRSTSYLYVRISVLGFSHSVVIAYNKRVRDYASGESRTAITWSRGFIGTHGSSSSFILSGVSEHMDRFIDEYLRVNASACKP